jgi:hypothetical protein
LEVSKKYYEKSRLPIQVKVLIRYGDLKGDPEVLASELVGRSAIGVWQLREFEFEPAERCNLEIKLVRLPDKFDRYSQWTFLDNRVGCSRPLDRIIIKDKVRRKAARLPQYKQSYADVMLLIVADRTYQSGMFHTVTEEISTPSFGFSSVYLALYPENYMRIG